MPTVEIPKADLYVLVTMANLGQRALFDHLAPDPGSPALADEIKTTAEHIRIGGRLHGRADEDVMADLSEMFVAILGSRYQEYLPREHS